MRTILHRGKEYTEGQTYNFEIRRFADGKGGKSESFSAELFTGLNRCFDAVEGQSLSAECSAIAAFLNGGAFVVATAGHNRHISRRLLGGKVGDGSPRHRYT